MDLGAVLKLVGTLAALTALGFLYRARTRVREKALEAIAKSLEHPVATDGGLIGSRLSIEVAVDYIYAGYGDTRTAIGVRIPEAYPLTISIGWRDPSTPAPTEALSDPELDRLYRIEVAPVDVARRVINPELRAVLRLHGAAASLETAFRGPAKVLVFVAPSYLNSADALQAIDALVAAAASVRDAYAAAEPAPVPVGAPFRPELDDAAARATAAARAAELEQLKTTRAARERASSRRTLAYVAGFVAFLVAMVATILAVLL